MTRPTDPKRRPARRSFVTGAAALLAGGSLASCAQVPGGPASPRARGFDFALFGDMPYNRAQEPEYERVLAELDARELAFAVHVGDFQFDPRPYDRNPAASRMPGDDATYDYVLKTLGASKNPMVVVLGDNDWADLFELKARSFDPLERLQKVRTAFFPRGKSLGQRTLAVVSQGDVDAGHATFRENLSWDIEGVAFATFHIVGSNDNVGRAVRTDEEQKQRRAAAHAWLERTFAQARERKSRGLVLITHANMGFENRWPGSYFGRYYRPLTGFKAPEKADATVYDDFIDALSRQMETFDAPTLLLHGDTHLFRVDKPLFSRKTQRPFENFTRIETFGWPDTHWVRIAVDPALPQLFSVHAQIVAGNGPNGRRSG
jgi:hypothetical protein